MLHCPVLVMPRRGGRVILPERLRWETLLLLRAADEALDLIRRLKDLAG